MRSVPQVISPRFAGSYDKLLGSRFAVAAGAVMVYSTGCAVSAGGAAYIIPAGWQYQPSMTAYWPHCTLHPLVDSRVGTRRSDLGYRREETARSADMALRWVSLSGRRSPEDREPQLVSLLKYLDSLTVSYTRVLEDGAVGFPGLSFQLLGRLMGMKWRNVSSVFHKLRRREPPRVVKRRGLICLSAHELRWKREQFAG